MKEGSEFCSKCGTEYELLPEVQALIKLKNKEKAYFNEKVTKLHQRLLKLSEIQRQLKTYDVKKINGRTSKYNVDALCGSVYLSTEEVGEGRRSSTRFKIIDGKVQFNDRFGNDIELTYEKYEYPYSTFDLANGKLFRFFKWIQNNGD